MKKKFTLIEMILVLGLMSVLLIPLNAMLSESYKAFIQTTEISENLYNGQQTINIILSKISLSQSADIKIIEKGIKIKNGNYTLIDNNIIYTNNNNDNHIILVKNIKEFNIIKEKNNVYSINIVFINSALDNLSSKAITREYRKNK